MIEIGCREVRLLGDFDPEWITYEMVTPDLRCQFMNDGRYPEEYMREVALRDFHEKVYGDIKLDLFRLSTKIRSYDYELFEKLMEIVDKVSYKIESS